MLCLIVLWGFPLVTSYSGVRTITVQQSEATLHAKPTGEITCLMSTIFTRFGMLTDCRRRRIRMLPVAIWSTCINQQPLRQPPMQAIRDTHATHASYIVNYGSTCAWMLNSNLRADRLSRSARWCSVWRIAYAHLAVCTRISECPTNRWLHTC